MSLVIPDTMVVDLRQNVVEWVKANIPGLAVVEKHGGKFDVAEIQRLVMNTPAVYVAAMNAMPPRRSYDGGDQLGGTGMPIFDLTMMAFIVTSDFRGMDADVAGWTFATRLAGAVQNNVFGSPVWPAHQVEVHNLWTRVLDNQGECIMAVAWCQPIVLGVDQSPFVTANAPVLMHPPVPTITPHTVGPGTPTWPVAPHPSSQSPDDPAGVMFPGVTPPTCDT